MVKKFRIPKDESINCKDWVEIAIDYDRKEFVAKKLKENFSENEEWFVFGDSTFPSSLFRDFLDKP